jgi:shikimate dehydrogenase
VTQVYGVFGWPVAHSRSPAMHNAAFAALGLDAVYVPLAIPPERLRHAVEATSALGLHGFNVTLPHKTTIMPLLASIEPSARAIGAVNTVVRDGARLVGTNTDAEGLARSLREANVVLQGADVVLLGAGGAARAAVLGLADAGAARICIAARKLEQAQALASSLATHTPATALRACVLDHSLDGTAPALRGSASLEVAFGSATLLVQATSATLGDTAAAQAFAAALPLEALPRSAVVCDLVYKPLETTLLARARTDGLRCVDGLGMLLHQGALAFERWTGKPAPLEAMRSALSGV